MSKGPRTETKTIDELQVTTTQLPPMSALVLSKRILPLVGPLLAPVSAIAAQMPKDADGTIKLDPDLIAGALAALDMDSIGAAFATLSDSDLERLTFKLLAGTSVKVDNEYRSLLTENDINAVFSGSFLTMLKAMWFAVVVNFFPTGAGGHAASSPKVALHST
jgi:hypothetical protein